MEYSGLDYILSGIIWDFDGNMVETLEKNYIVTKKIISHVKKIPFEEVGKRYPLFKSLESYKEGLENIANWKEIYTVHSGMSEEEMIEAKGMWGEYQLKDHTPAKLFDGIEDTIRDLVPIPQVIVSQNSRENILCSLEYMHMFFSGVVDYDEIDNEHQKPHHLPLRLGIETFNPGLKKPGYVISIGDHATDSHMVANFNRTTDSGVIVVHYASTWANGKNNVKDWEFQPYEVLNHPSEILDEIKNFSPHDYEMLENGVLIQL